MYSQVAGTGLVAGVPAALAFTGVSSAGFALTVGAALALLAIGVAMLRRCHRSR